jgi:hypothetical protein
MKGQIFYKPTNNLPSNRSQLIFRMYNRKALKVYSITLRKKNVILTIEANVINYKSKAVLINYETFYEKKPSSCM